MSNSSDDREKLLAETFQGDWSTGPAARFARQAAAAARRRESSRRWLVASSVTAGIAAVWLVALRTPSLAPRALHPAAAPAPAYEIISDDELLAQLKDRPLLVIPGENGIREFVLLDR